MINGLFETFRTKGGCQKKRETITFSMSQASRPQERKIATPFEEKLLRPVGGLTYCISAGWERTSNLALLLPVSRLGASGNNSFSDCWSKQCPWYWKPTALGVSNLQSKQFKILNSLGLFAHLVQFVFLMEGLYGDLHQ